MSTIHAVPPGFSTRCVSASALSGSRKFLKAAVQTMKSNGTVGKRDRCHVALPEVDVDAGLGGVAPGDFNEIAADVEPE